jgi:hypothetical protein
MALLKNIKIQGNIDLVDVYYRVSSVTLNFMTKTMNIRMDAFVNAVASADYETKRAAHQVAYLTYAEKTAAMAAISDSPGTEAAETLATLAAEQGEAKTLTHATSAALEEALPIPGAAVDLTVMAEKLADVVDANGEIDRASVYAYVKTLPEWSTAVDA